VHWRSFSHLLFGRMPQVEKSELFHSIQDKGKPSASFRCVRASVCHPPAASGAIRPSQLESRKGELQPSSKIAESRRTFPGPTALFLTGGSRDCHPDSCPLTYMRRALAHHPPPLAAHPSADLVPSHTDQCAAARASARRAGGRSRQNKRRQGFGRVRRALPSSTLHHHPHQWSCRPVGYRGSRRIPSSSAGLSRNLACSSFGG